MPQQWFDSPPPMVIHTVRSISALKTNRREFTQKAGAAAPKEGVMVHVMMMMLVCLQGVTLVSPVNLTPSLTGTEAVFWGKVN